MAEKFLVAKASAGMGNRLLALCTAILYAQMAERTLVIDWRDGAYGEKGKNTFNNFFKCLLAKPISSLPKTGAVTPAIWKGNLNKISQSLSNENKTHMEKISVDLSSINHPEKIAVFCTFTQKIHILRQHFKGKFSEFRDKTDNQILRMILGRHIFLNEDIKKEIEQFRKKNFARKTIGVHVRFTDMKVNVDKIIGTVDRIRTKKSKIFLATDSRQIVNMFRKRYGEIITAEKWYPPVNERMHTNKNCKDRQENGRQAVMDMCLLAQCNSLVYSGRSSFGRVAQLLSKACRLKIFNIDGANKMDFLKYFAAKYF
jgi:hypothetical protein